MASPPSTRPVPLDTPQIPNPDIGLCGGTGARFGPEIGLARQVYADTGQAATIVKAAMPGTSITEWAPKADEQLLPVMVKEVKSAIASDRRHGFVDTIGGFYWYDGETDRAYVPWADLCRGNLSRLIQNVRKDFPMGKAPVGIVMATEDGSYIPPGMQIVRTADVWAATHLANVVTVDSKGSSPRIGASTKPDSQSWWTRNRGQVTGSREWPSEEGGSPGSRPRHRPD
jgi:hypothetical protein